MRKIANVYILANLSIDSDRRILRNMVNTGSFESVMESHRWMPEMLPAWSKALSLIDKNPERVNGGGIGKEALQTMNGYAYPPPSIFCGSEHGAFLLLTWLHFRPTWMGALKVGQHALTNRSAPKADTWKRGLWDLLVKCGFKRYIPDKPRGPGGGKRSAGVSVGAAVVLPPLRIGFSSLPPRPTTTVVEKANTPVRGKTSVALPEHSTSHAEIKQVKGKKGAEARRTAKRTERAKEAFDSITTNLKEVNDREIFYGHVLAWGNEKSYLDIHGISNLAMWELCELNFRADVVVLDRMLLPDLWTRGDGRDRMTTISELFSLGQLTPNLPFMSFNSGHLGHDRGVEPDMDRDRVWTLWGKIVGQWPCPPGHKELTKDMTREEIAITLNGRFIQCFFDFFGRCPSIPRILPEASAR